MAAAVVEKDTDGLVSLTVVSKPNLLDFQKGVDGSPGKDPVFAPGSAAQKAEIADLFFPAATDEANKKLFFHLLGSLESLKDVRSDSGAVSPSPHTVSTAGSADPVPSTPTDYEASPQRSMSSSDLSPDTLAAAVQQLSLSQGGRAPAETHAFPAPGWTAPAPPLPAPMDAAALHHLSAQQAALAAAQAAAAQAAAFQQMLGVAPGVAPGVELNPALFGLTPGISMVHRPPGPVLDLGAIPSYAFPGGYTPRGGRGAAGPARGNYGRPAPRCMAPDFEECLVGPEGRYQAYCRQIITEEINVVALRVLHHVRAAQLTDVHPALSCYIGKRYFCSLKEVSKVVESARLLLIAPDVRPSHSAHIKPVQMLQEVMAAADAADVPYVFCLSRKGIGQVFGREKSMSIVAVMHLEGIEAECLALVEAAARGRRAYVEHLDRVGVPGGRGRGGMPPMPVPMGLQMPYVGAGIDLGVGVGRLPPMSPFLPGRYPVDPF